MSWVGFEPTTPVLEGTKAVHVLDRAVTVVGKYALCSEKIEHSVQGEIFATQKKCKLHMYLYGTYAADTSPYNAIY
jgi:hypothetical protein